MKIVHEKAKRKAAVLVELASLGLTRRRIAAHMGTTVATVGAWCSKRGVKTVRDSEGWEPATRASRQRAEVMAALYASGQTLDQIGRQYGITRERVRQLIKKHFRMTGKDGGAMTMARRRAEVAKAKRDAKALARHGCTFAQWQELRDLGYAMLKEGRGKYQTPLYAFRNQENNAKRRGIGWELTLWQWWTIWQASGHWHERGLREGNYVMCRKGDVGPYAVDNVFIALSIENISTGNRKFDTDLPIGVHRTAAGTYAAIKGGKGLGTYPTAEMAHAAYILGRPVMGTVKARRVRSGLPSGVRFNGRSYAAYIYIGSKQKHLGVFPTIGAALAARRAAEADLRATKQAEAA